VGWLRVPGDDVTPSGAAIAGPVFWKRMTKWEWQSQVACVVGTRPGDEEAVRIVTLGLDVHGDGVQGPRAGTPPGVSWDGPDIAGWILAGLVPSGGQGA
jgi:hypothetical protein